MTIGALPAHAAGITWNAASGAWNTGSNWTGGLAPGAGDVGGISNLGTATVGAGGSITVTSARLVEGTLTVTGGLITATNTATTQVRIGQHRTAVDPASNVTLSLSGDVSITSANILYIAEAFIADTDFQPVEDVLHSRDVRGGIRGIFTKRASGPANGIG